MADLRQALIVSASSINETNGLGQSALHLAVEWPRGMDLLLQAGANTDCEDHFYQTPISYAIEMSLIEPMRLLALADCSILDMKEHLLLARAVDIELSTHLDRGQSTAAEAVVNLLVDMIANRRQRLYDLASSTLPDSDLDRLCHDSYLPDDNAPRLYSALVRHGTAVPLALHPRQYRSTVFHQIGPSLRVAERLWNAGFRDINGRDSFGLTPLMSSRAHHFCSPDDVNLILEYAAWLVEKGADFYAKQDLTLYEHYRPECQLLSATALHFVAYELGLNLKRMVTCNRLEKWAEESFSEPSKETLQRILMDMDSDSCTCACSISGCSPLTVFNKNYITLYPAVYILDLWPILENFCDPSKISEFLRIMTFKELDITHTCCQKDFHGWETKDKAEIDEIHDEEAENLQKLEELLEEFEAKRKELDIPFGDFITKYWQPRMKEVLQEGTLDEDALREIGVEVYELE